jgi:hypothetical protein
MPEPQLNQLRPASYALGLDENHPFDAVAMDFLEIHFKYGNATGSIAPTKLLKRVAKRNEDRDVIRNPVIWHLVDVISSGESDAAREAALDFLAFQVLRLHDRLKSIESCLLTENPDCDARTILLGSLRLAIEEDRPLAGGYCDHVYSDLWDHLRASVDRQNQILFDNKKEREPPQYFDEEDATFSDAPREDDGWIDDDMEALVARYLQTFRDDPVTNAYILGKLEGETDSDIARRLSLKPKNASRKFKKQAQRFRDYVEIHAKRGWRPFYSNLLRVGNEWFWKASGSLAHVSFNPADPKECSRSGGCWWHGDDMATESKTTEPYDPNRTLDGQDWGEQHAGEFTPVFEYEIADGTVVCFNEKQRRQPPMSKKV